MSDGAFRARLEREFASRKAKNSRFSLRAFATLLGADHSTVAQVMRGTRPAPKESIRSWGRKLGMEREEVAAYIAAEHVPESATLQRQAQLRHWTAEAMSIVEDPIHWEIVQMRPEQLESKKIAAQIGATSDKVNIALARLLRLGLLDGDYQDESEFKTVALSKIREKAAWRIR
jgi:hypothetical protein